MPFFWGAGQDDQDSDPEDLGELSCMPKGEQGRMIWGLFVEGEVCLQQRGLCNELACEGNPEG